MSRLVDYRLARLQCGRTRANASSLADPGGCWTSQMLSRFSLPALRVLHHARAEVSRLGASALDPAHVLLGVLDEGDALGALILSWTCGRIDDLRDDILQQLPRHDAVPESQEIPFSASTIQVLQYAAEEADRQLHDHIGTEHLLLGVMREERSVAAAVLAARRVSLDVLREAVAAAHRGEQQEFPGPPPTPANTYKWPHIPFVPSRTVHILHSGLQPPSPPAIHHPGPVFSAYGFTLEEIIVRAWEGNRWHVEIPIAVRGNARFDFLLVLPQPETTAVCLALLRSAIEQQFGVHVTLEMRLRDVYRVASIPSGGQMLRRYPDPPAGSGFSMLSFSSFTGRSPASPTFPLDRFAVHSVPFFLLVHWFEEILGGQIVDETRLQGIYGFELKKRVDTSDAFIQLLRDEAGLVITRERRAVPTLIVRQAGVS